MTRKELLKRATILNMLELAFNENQDLYGLEIDQVNEGTNENFFKCLLYNATTLEKINEISGNYGKIKSYILSLHIIRACGVDGVA